MRAPCDPTWKEDKLKYWWHTCTYARASGYQRKRRTSHGSVEGRAGVFGLRDGGAQDPRGSQEEKFRRCGSCHKHIGGHQVQGRDTYMCLHHMTVLQSHPCLVRNEPVGVEVLGGFALAVAATATFFAGAALGC